MGGFMVMARRQASLVPNVISKIGDIQILFANRVKFLGSSSDGRVEVVAVRLTQANVEAAARSVAISLATLMRRQREPEFQKALRQA